MYPAHGSNCQHHLITGNQYLPWLCRLTHVIILNHVLISLTSVGKHVLLHYLSELVIHEQGDVLGCSG